jgi:hypothetical protein
MNEHPGTDKLIIFDTTMRDGEQSPGASMTRGEKLRIAWLALSLLLAEYDRRTRSSLHAAYFDLLQHSDLPLRYLNHGV